nr:MAG TPA: hypothetical protein [Caudoviricetes sp.]DAM79283.1 MAG TPA: hypothetical protein [Caudoviricetes sp.]DAO83919.1 MAG TPA: hypothetical protein [Caudoviricetes sp.]
MTFFSIQMPALYIYWCHISIASLSAHVLKRNPAGHWRG